MGLGVGEDGAGAGAEGLVMAAVTGPAPGTHLGFGHGGGRSSAPLANGELRLLPAPGTPLPAMAEGILSAVEQEDEGARPAPLDPLVLAVPLSLQPAQRHGSGDGRVGGLGAPPACGAVRLLWFNANQISQPGKSLNAESCCWRPSWFAAVWGFWGGKWEAGWGLRGHKVEGIVQGSLTASGSWFESPSRGAVRRGRALGTAPRRYEA